MTGRDVILGKIIKSIRIVIIFMTMTRWNGTIENNGTTLHFQMKIIQSPVGITGAMVTDGHGIILLNGNATEWPAGSIMMKKILAVS